MAALNSVCLFFAIAWTFIVGFIGVMVLFMSSFIGGLVLIAIGAAPTVVMLKINKARSNALEEDLRRMVGLASGSGYVYGTGYGSVTGIALNAATQKIALAEGNVRKVYDFTEIREWETNHETPGTFIGTGMTVASANLRETMLAARRSGLFITVRDIDHPKWRIALPQKEHARWMEIMRQVVNRQ